MGVDADTRWMRRALELAHAAQALGEVPVGAVVVLDGDVLAEAHNRTLMDCDPTAHAEIVALRTAAARAGNHRLPRAELYVTLEPCAMCAGAAVQARLRRVVYATADPRAGAVRSVFRVLDAPALNHRCTWEEGVLADASAAVLRDFFRLRRGE